MIQQLVASRARTFVGAYYSTISGYVNRLRGYHAQNKKSEGFEQGVVKSYYYAEKNRKFEMRLYRSMREPTSVWEREWPVGWRDIDHDLERLG